VLEQGGRPRVPGFQFDPQSNQILGLGVQYSNNPQDIVRTKLLAAHGKELGVQFDDDAVDQFIQSYVDDRLSTQEVETILREASGGLLSYYEVRELLKEELTAMVVQQTALAGIFTESQSQMSPIVSPGKAFSDFMKLNQSAKVEAFPVFVDDYVSQVTDSPSEAEIQAIYEAGASVPSNPNSPEPGFLRLYQANLEYVEASLQDWIEREKGKLTEEELRAEYTRRVELGQLQVPVTEEAPEATNNPVPAETTTPDTTGDETSIEDPQTSSEGDTPESDTGNPEEKGSEEPATSDDDKLGLANDSNVRFVSYTQDENAEATEPAQQSTAEISQVAEPTDSMPPPVVQPPQLGQEGAGQADSGPQMRTKTFEEAREEIADSLARDAAIPALENALTDLYDNTMRPFYGKYRQYQAFVESGLKDENGQEREPPPAPDLKKLATDAGLKYSDTGLVDGIALAQTPFGQGNIRPDETGASGSVANVMMTPATELYRPARSTYFDQAALAAGEMPEFLQYLLWKTTEKEAYIPDLDEVREEVVEAWKRIQARQLAENAARDLADKVRTVLPSATQTPSESDAASEVADAWADALSETDRALVIETEPFTWMNRLGEFITTSPVNKLDRVGAEFMRQVFSTRVGQVAVAPNANRNIYYVFRVTDLAPSDPDLQARFEADPIKSGPRRIAFEESQRLFASWVENLQQDMELEWQTNVGQFE
ncbi:MAG: hypothetical protein NXI32_30395, partial [bacterium]|nr:hypothetical protein [bacterium]